MLPPVKTASVSSSVRIRHIYISAGHNFFGRHGEIPHRFPMIEQKQVECVAGRGLFGDRFFDYKPNYSGQITFFALENYERLCHELGVGDKEPSVFRRNV